MQTKTKQQGATQAQLAHRAEQFKRWEHEQVRLCSRRLNYMHQRDYAAEDAAEVGNDLLDAMAEAGL